MRVLLVEDKIEYAKLITAKLGELPDCEVRWAKSRDGAESILREENFDLIILDRRIPSADGALDDSPEHGFHVFQVAQEACEGTPVWFLTGTEDADFPVEVNNKYGRREDIHGIGVQEPLCMVFWKRQLTEALREAKTFAERHAELSAIAIVNPGAANLAAAELTNIRIFGRRYAATAVEVTALGGGLSSARVVKVVARNAAGAPIHTAVAKIGTLSSVRDEHDRYTKHISRLGPGDYPPLSIRIDAGSGPLGGLYYSMVGTQVTTLLDRIIEGGEGVSDIPAAMHKMQDSWHKSSEIRPVTVGQIRRRFIDDAKIPDIEAELQDIDLTVVEKVVVTGARCTQHNDMHVLNVLFDGSAKGFFIDYNDAGQSFAAADPVTLELSLLFHKEHAKVGTEWPSVNQMEAWSNLETYVEGCAFGDFIRGCRRWALAVAGSPEEVVATAYAYAVRQLKYADTRKDLARGLIRGAITVLTQ
ncbi:response regulator [Rhizobium leguminosarum]|uniref:response regulator n=1 Tax=Rhizobium leguminosarum TaxID=384 RepID=UPI0013EE6DD1|nr:response regulator [Rhizobium leguminosarum]